MGRNKASDVLAHKGEGCPGRWHIEGPPSTIGCDTCGARVKGTRGNVDAAWAENDAKNRTVPA